MIVVVDASAAVKLALDEESSDIVREIWDEPVRWVSPSIVLAEVASAIAAAGRNGRLAAEAVGRAQSDWSAVSGEIDLIGVDVPLSTRAAGLAASRLLRGMDAVYLATAAALAGADDVGLLSFDRRRRAGLDPADGVALLPAALPGAAE